jgi:hypothetical protein
MGSAYCAIVNIHYSPAELEFSYPPRPCARHSWLGLAFERREPKVACFFQRMSPQTTGHDLARARCVGSGDECDSCSADHSRPNGHQASTCRNRFPAHAHPGDRLDFVVTQDVNIEGFTAIPAGTVARGSVTRVKGKRLLGIGGRHARNTTRSPVANCNESNSRLTLPERKRTLPVPN